MVIMVFEIVHVCTTVYTPLCKELSCLSLDFLRVILP
jgi:hypothetical protein